MKKMPAHLPPLPDGAVYLGRGGEFAVPGGRMGGWACSDTPPREWLHQGHAWKGNGISNHYAAPADSEIARLNGCGKPSWDDAPEGATHLAQHDDGGWVWFIGCEWRDPKPTHCGGWEFYGCGPQEVLDCEFVENGCQPNPNWRDTLERRPSNASGPHTWAFEAAAEGQFGIITCDASSGAKPDLIIPADIAKHADIHSLVALHRDGYRIEWDSNGIRGWKE